MRCEHTLIDNFAQIGLGYSLLPEIQFFHTLLRWRVAWSDDFGLESLGECTLKTLLQIPRKLLQQLGAIFNVDVLLPEDRGDKLGNVLVHALIPL